MNWMLIIFAILMFVFGVMLQFAGYDQKSQPAAGVVNPKLAWYCSLVLIALSLGMILPISVLEVIR